ncbi:MAG: hypothetical protein IPM53_25485 [Anaerolineaceae bacterium]|nr:hypothetical protein [Anaerolineaceae bacterium]
MSKSESSNLLPEWIQKQLAEYRQRATEFEQWPQTADSLMTLLTQPAQPPGSDERDDHMLSLVVNDALTGIDIAQRYPTFYQKMMVTPWLFQAFLDALDILEADDADELTSLPKAASRDLSFLKETPSEQPKVDQSPKGNWQVTWQLLVDELRRLLFSSPGLAYRGVVAPLEDESFLVLHDEVEVSGQLLEVLLEAVHPVARPETWRLQVFVASQAKQPAATIQASISWGLYVETAVLDKYGRAHFPPLHLESFLDESGQVQVGDLQLVLTLQ